jgi:DNA replication protein DnaC
MKSISQILKETNLSADVTGHSSNVEGTLSDLETINVCSRCKGAGFMHPILPNSKPDYSRVIPCDCSRLQKKQSLAKFSNLGALAGLTFEKLLPQGLSGSGSAQARFKTAYETAYMFAEAPKGWLVLVGPTGSGKTKLAAAIAAECLNRGQTIFFITVADLFDQLHASLNQESPIPHDRFFEQVKDCPLLILDDLNIRSATPWSQEKLDQLLNHRLQHELPTVITTEVAPADLNDRWRCWLNNSNLSIVLLLGDDTRDLELTWQPGFKLQQIMTFNNFDHNRLNLDPETRDNLERAYLLALDFAHKPEGWLVLQGVTGSGKTHLAAAIVNFRYQSGQPAMFVVVPEFLDHLRSSFSPDSKTNYDQLFERVKTTPLLVLDDFGEQSATPWAQEKLYQVINYRYNAQIPTVITTAHSLEELENRISSRLADRKMSVAFNIMAPDYRTDLTGSQTKKMQRKALPRRDSRG